MKCDTYKEEFSLKSSLTQHVKSVHDQKKPYRKGFHCKICDQKFNQKFKLNKHLLTVHKDANLSGKTFPCTNCDEVFILKAKLNKHLKLVHMESKTKGENPFKCTVCKKTFALKISLTKHIRSIHEEKSEPSTPSNRNYSIVKGWRSDSNCYLLDGFSYIKNSMSSKTIYLNCNERNNKENSCEGYANINRFTDHMFVKRPHNHEPRQEKIKVNEIRHAIFDAAKTASKKNLRQTFAAETEKEALGHKVFYTSVESSMRQKRGENYPHLPRTFEEVPDSGTPEQARPARPRSGLDFQIHNVA